MPGPLSISGAPWLPLDRAEFDRLEPELAERLWTEVAKMKERQPDDARSWRCRFAPRPDLGGTKVEVEWQTKRIGRDGWSTNVWFYIATDEMLRGKE